MRVMKDSGIEWIGEIPKEWNIERLKLHAHFNPETTLPEFSDEDHVSFIPMDHLKSGYHTQSSTVFDKVKKGYVSFAEDDILMAKVTPCLENGNLAIATDLIDGVGFGSTEINVIRCKTINNKYLFYLLQCQSYIKKATYNMFGVAGLKRLTPEFIPNSFFPIPSYEEQLAIVEYLDNKCSEINTLIASKEKTNALLKERRQSMIYEAVTKGLDPAAPMKDSGVEWIGKIPDSWELRKIKHNFDVVAGATPKSGEMSFWDGDIPWITPADYTTEDVFVSAGRKNITREGMNSCATTMIPEGSIVFSKRAPVGLVAISSNRLCTNQGCLSCVPKENVDAKYFYYTMSVFNKQFDLFASGTTFKELSADSFANFKLPFPNYGVQREIAAYLDNKCSELDFAALQNNTTIQKLKEYRQSLIYEVVTGKIEIQ